MLLPLAYPDEGRRLVRYWSTDQVNNRELDRALVLITDNTPPQIFANFSLAKTATASADGLPVYRRLTSLFLGATDNAVRRAQNLLQLRRRQGDGIFHAAGAGSRRHLRPGDSRR